MNNLIEEQAIRWLEAFDDDQNQHSNDVQAEFESWLAANPDHKVTYEKLKCVYESQELVLALNEYREGQGTLEVAKPTPQSKSKLAWNWYTAGALACLVFVGVIFIPFGFEQRNTNESIVVSDVQIYKTAIKERKVVTMKDGTQIHLNANSHLEITLGEAYRKVILKKGAAFFDVVSNPDKRFVVKTKFGDVNVLGTMFSVESHSGDILVAVEEGHVQVVYESAKDLFANQKIVMNKKGTSAVETLDTNETIAQWRSGWVDIHSQPLNELLNQLLNYLEKPVIFVDKLPEEPVISGRYHLDEPAKALKLIATLNNLILEEREDAYYFSLRK